jgi:hypothetical protein
VWLADPADAGRRSPAGRGRAVRRRRALIHKRSTRQESGAGWLTERDSLDGPPLVPAVVRVYLDEGHGVDRQVGGLGRDALDRGKVACGPLVIPRRTSVRRGFGVWPGPGYLRTIGLVDPHIVETSPNTTR